MVSFPPFRVRTRPIAKIGSLVHINPERIDVYSIFRVEEQFELIIPVILSPRMKPIRKCSDTRPDGT